MKLVFGKEGCEPCRKAKQLVEQEGGIYITCTPEMLQMFKDAGFKTMPIVTSVIGGYQEYAQIAANTFADLLRDMP